MKLNNAIDKVGRIAEKVTRSQYYILGVNAFILLCWATGWFFAAVAVFFLAFLVILMTQKNLNGIMPFFASIIFSVGNTGGRVGHANVEPVFFDSFLIVLYCFLPFFLAALVWFFVRNKTELKIGRIFPSLAIFFAAAALGGAGAGMLTFSRALTVLAFGAGIVFAYALFRNTIDFKAAGFKKYFCLCFLAACMLITSEVAIAVLRSGNPVEYIKKQQLYVGWGIGNTVGQIIGMFIPFVFYLIIISEKKREVIFYNIAVIIIGVTILITMSRTALLIAMLTIIPLYILTHRRIDKTKKKTNLLTLAGIAAAGLLVFAVFHGKIIDLIVTNITGLGGAKNISSGRFSLWGDGLLSFFESPIFGKSFFHTETGHYTGKLEDFLGFYWYHNTFIQILVNMGLVGFLAFGYFLYKKYLLFFKKADVLNLFIFMALIISDLQGMLDMNAVSLACNIFIVMFIVGAEQLISEPETNLFRRKKIAAEGEV